MKLLFVGNTIWITVIHLNWRIERILIHGRIVFAAVQWWNAGAESLEVG